MMVGWWVSFWDCLFLGAMLNFRGVKFLMGIILIPQTFKKHVVFRVFFQKIPLVKMDEKTPGCFERMNWAMKKSQLRVYRGWYYTVIWGIKMKYIRIYIYRIPGKQSIFNAKGSGPFLRLLSVAPRSALNPRRWATSVSGWGPCSISCLDRGLSD